MASSPQRDARRAISSWLTEQINRIDLAGDTEYDKLVKGVRAEVLKALQLINRRLLTLNEDFQKEYFVANNKNLTTFYMKGGNAYACSMQPDGDAAQQKGGGDSDWDTQVMIDPWAPLALQNEAYRKVEGVVYQTLRDAGKQIAKLMKTYSDRSAQDFEATIKNRWGAARTDINGKNYIRYSLDLIQPQVYYRVYDEGRLDITLEDPVSTTGVTYVKGLPGIIFNDAIKPFGIYRLGFNWSCSYDGSVGDDVVTAGEITQPILMELIDVTIPRSDTVEIVEMWQAIALQHINVELAEVKVQGTDSGFEIPLPDLDYHYRENLTMLCEVADGSSEHADKMDKRIKRVNEVYAAQVTKQPVYNTIIDHMMGVASASALIDDDLDKFTGDLFETAFGKYHKGDTIKNEMQKNPVRDSYNLYDYIRCMMLYIKSDSQKMDNDTWVYFKRSNTKGGVALSTTTSRYSSGFSVAGRGLLEFWENFDGMTEVKVLQAAFDTFAGEPVTLDKANSSDIVLMEYFLENGFIDPEKVGFSGVNYAMLVRVPNFQILDYIVAYFLSMIEKYPYLTTAYKVYNTQRASGLSYECILVTFVEGRTSSFITLTTASPEQAPFLKSPTAETKQDLKAFLVAPSPDIGRQRQVAAGLLENYLVRKALSRQFEATKTLTLLV